MSTAAFPAAGGPRRRGPPAAGRPLSGTDADADADADAAIAAFRSIGMPLPSASPPRAMAAGWPLGDGPLADGPQRRAQRLLASSEAALAAALAEPPPGLRCGRRR